MDREKRDMQALVAWFMRSKRSLPWRQNHSPYRVWISEVMLQQTQVSVVIPYFERWMELFPTIEALAKVSIDEVIKAWEGLGYYSRARNLHAGAREIVEKYGGVFPADREQLLKIKGLGPYTVGAIMAFAYQERAPAVDGNVRRVLARYDAVKDSIDLPRIQKQMEERMLGLLPTKDPQHVMEGLIELGALVCQKTPKCMKCPLSSGCKGYSAGLQNELPIRRKRQKTLALHRFVYILIHKEHVLIRQEVAAKVMKDLWHFPFFEEEGHIDVVQAEEKLTALIGQIVYIKELERIKHGFTRYQATLYPHVWEVKCRKALSEHTWMPIDELSSLPFCAGHRELARHLKRTMVSLGS